MTDRPTDLRRRQIIEAVVDVTARGGLQSATFRTIADQAGVSVRLVQYYFGTKDQLLTDTLAHVGGLAAQRIAAELAALGPEPSPRSVVSTIFERFLPLDDERRRAMLVFIAFRTAALTDAALSSSEKLGLGQSLVSTVAAEIERAVAGGHAAAGIAPRSEAILLVSAMTGLANMILAGEADAGEARDHLTYALDRVLPA